MTKIKEMFDKEEPRRITKMEGTEKYVQGFGSGFIELHEDDIQHLREGKILYHFDGEYEHYFRLKTSMEEALE